MGCLFGMGEGGKNHSMLTTKKLDYTTVPDRFIQMPKAAHYVV